MCFLLLWSSVPFKHILTRLPYISFSTHELTLREKLEQVKVGSFYKLLFEENSTYVQEDCFACIIENNCSTSTHSYDFTFQFFHNDNTPIVVIFLNFGLSSHQVNLYYLYFKFGHFRAKYQGSSLTVWPKMAHFHHFSICNQNE